MKIAIDARLPSAELNQFNFASRLPKAASSAAMSSCFLAPFEDFDDFALVSSEILDRAKAESFCASFRLLT